MKINMFKKYQEFLKLNDEEFARLTKYYNSRQTELKLMQPQSEQEWENSYRFSVTYPFACLKHEPYLIDSIIDLLPEKDMRILDFGAGTGMNLLELHERGYYGLFYYDVGIIMNEFFLEILLTENINNITQFRNGFFENNNLDNYFDVIICQEVIEHVKDYPKLTEMLCSKIRKGGLLIAINQFAKDDSHHEHFMEHTDFKQLMTELGFTEIRGKVWKKN